MTLTDLIIRIFLTGLILASLLFPAHNYKENLNITKGIMVIESYSKKAKTLNRTTLEEYKVVIYPKAVEIIEVSNDKNEPDKKIERSNMDIHNIDMHKIYETSYKEKKNVEIEKNDKEIIITWKGVK